VPDPADAAADGPIDAIETSNWANHDGMHMVTTYAQFIEMKPPTFIKVEEPLDAGAWVRAIEAKFSAFVLHYSEER
jgi:hypothetical protein